MCCRYIDLEDIDWDKCKEPETAHKIDEWCRTYMKVLCTALNTQHNYVQGELKKMEWKMMDDNDGSRKQHNN